MEKITQINALHKLLVEDYDLDAKIWKNQRIYLSGYGRDINAYIVFDEPESEAGENLFWGCSIKVYTNCAQAKQWKVNRLKQVKHRVMQDLSAAVGIPVCARWQDVIV